MCLQFAQTVRCHLEITPDWYRNSSSIKSRSASFITETLCSLIPYLAGNRVLQGGEECESGSWPLPFVT